MGAKKVEERQEKVKVESIMPPKPTQAIIKIIEVELGKEFQEPEGWFIREVHVLDSKAVLLVLVKNQQKPLRMSQPVNLKD